LCPAPSDVGLIGISADIEAAVADPLVELASDRFRVLARLAGDIPTFGKPLVISAEVNRYRCRECGATSMQELPAMDSQRRMTKRLVDYVLQQGIDQSYSAVARHIAVDEKTVRQMCLANVQSVVKTNLTEAPIILGIDEVHLAKAKRTVFVDVAGRRFLDMIETMSKAAVTQWLSWMPHRDRVRIVTIDMWGPYKEVAEALLPNAIIVVDRFHVVKKIEEALRDVRTRVRKGAKGKARKNPRRGRILLHKRPEKLSPMRRMMLDALLANEPMLKVGWETKEAFHAIWKATDRAAAEKAFDDWKAAIPASVAAEFGAVASTVENGSRRTSTVSAGATSSTGSGRRFC
jgi:transposase